MDKVIVTANFAKSTIVKVTTNDANLGSAGVRDGNNLYDKAEVENGESITLCAVPKADARFEGWYAKKSGSETQVPYYVAIAASFYQLYRYGNSVRLMLLDEAFDKMDDERIQSMMDFFNGLDLQVILATPPAKIEVIGEKVGTILTAIRVGQNSIVEEYDL